MDGPFRESCQPSRSNSGVRVYFETWFRTLKFGTRIKDRRLDDTEGLRECLAFDTVTAVHMADLTVLARGRPETPVT